MNFSCIVCNSNKYAFVGIKNNYKLYLCLNCEFIFIYPRPSIRSLKRYYSNFDYKDEESSEIRIRKDAIVSLRFISKYVPLDKSILDLGCGRGYFLDEARRKGWKGKGVDYSSKIVEFAKTKLNLDVIRCDINVYTDKTKYGLISMSQVIEHIPNPNLLVKNISKLLQKNGYIYIITPNVSSASSKIFKMDFEHIIPPEHINYFNRKSLTKLLENNGFRIVSFSTWGYPENMAGIIKQILHPKKSITLLDGNNMTSGTLRKNKSNHSIKSYLFDNLFCRTTYKILDYLNLGINIQILAQKI